MKNILINVQPTTAYFQSMVEYAIKIAKHFNSTVTFIEILETYGPPRFEKEEKDLKNLIVQIQPFLKEDDQNIHCQYQVWYGQPKKVLIEITPNLNPDLLIVNSSPDRSSHAGASMEIAQHVPCPVMLMPPSETQRSIKRIVYTTEFAFDDINALSFLREWAKMFDATLLCLHVCKNETEVAKAEKKMEVLKTHFPNKEFQYQVIIGDILDSIQQTMILRQTDLIVGLHRRRGWWAKLRHPSITGKIAKKITIPMILFKEQV